MHSVNTDLRIRSTGTALGHDVAYLRPPAARLEGGRILFTQPKSGPPQSVSVALDSETRSRDIYEYPLRILPYLDLRTEEDVLAAFRDFGDPEPLVARSQPDGSPTAFINQGPTLWMLQEGMAGSTPRRIEPSGELSVDVMRAWFWFRVLGAISAETVWQKLRNSIDAQDDPDHPNLLINTGDLKHMRSRAEKLWASVNVHDEPDYRSRVYVELVNLGLIGWGPKLEALRQWDNDRLEPVTGESIELRREVYEATCGLLYKTIEEAATLRHCEECGDLFIRTAPRPDKRDEGRRPRANDNSRLYCSASCRKRAQNRRARAKKHSARARDERSDNG